MSKGVWFVTGSSSGIGLELVIALLDSGYSVIATARNLDSLKDILEKNPENSIGLVLVFFLIFLT
jgi:NADP-dependent 3-hydroxy acid dehydrogenase YdfG